jgi:hypothetical protein
MFAAANLQIRPLPLSLIVESGDSTQRFYYAHTFIESALAHTLLGVGLSDFIFLNSEFLSPQFPSKLNRRIHHEAFVIQLARRLLRGIQ